MTTQIDNFKSLELVKILGDVWAIYEPKVIPYLSLLEPHAYAPGDHLKEFRAWREENKIESRKALGDQEAIRNRRDYTVSNKTAIMEFVGPVTKRPTSFGYMFGEFAMQTAGQMMGMALKDEDVDRIIMDIDSPGGIVDGGIELSQLIKFVDEQKPVFTYGNGTIGSMGYFIGVNSRYIGLSPDGMAGSIGALTYLSDTSKLADKIGVKVHRIRFPEHKNSVKGLGVVPGQKIKQHELDHMQELVNTFGKQFASIVTKNRGLTRSDIIKMGGRVYVGKEAENMGLVDGVHLRSEFIELVSSGQLDSIKSKKLYPSVLNNRSAKTMLFGKGKKNTAAFRSGPEDDEDEDEDENTDEETTTDDEETDKPAEEQPSEDKEMVAYLKGKEIKSVAQLEGVFANATLVGDYKKNLVAEGIKQYNRFFAEKDRMPEAEVKKMFSEMPIAVLKSATKNYSDGADKLFGISAEEGAKRLTAPSGQATYSSDVTEEKATAEKEEAKGIVNRVFGRRVKNGR